MSPEPAPRHRRPGTDLLRVPLQIRILAQAADGHVHHTLPPVWYAFDVHATPAQFYAAMAVLLTHDLVDYCPSEDCVLFPRNSATFSVVPSPAGRALMGRYLHR